MLLNTRRQTASNPLSRRAKCFISLLTHPRTLSATLSRPLYLSAPPRRAASIAATSIFFIVIIVSNARLAAAGSVPITASVRARGVICHDRPQRSLHQPHSLSCPPLLTIAFHKRSVSAWSSVAIWNENASLCLNAGPPLSPRQAMPATVNSTVRTSPCLPAG